MIQAALFEPVEGATTVWFDPFAVVMVRTYIVSRTIMGRYKELETSVISFVDGKEIMVEGHKVAQEIVRLRSSKMEGG